MPRNVESNPSPQEDEIRHFLKVMRSPKTWEHWPAMLLSKDGEDGIVLDPPWTEFVDSKGKHLPGQDQRPHESKDDWLRRAVFFDLNYDSLPPKPDLVRALMLQQLVDWNAIPHKVYKDFAEMYAAGWRLAQMYSNPRKLDPERARHTTMMATPERWPAWPMLPLKNPTRGVFGPKGTGLLLDTVEFEYKHTVFLVNMFEVQSLDPERDIDSIPHETYSSYGAIYEAGWRVD